MNIIVILRDRVYSQCMSLTLKPAKSRQLKTALRGGLFTAKEIKRLLRLTFISGPWLMFTSQLSIKSAVLMMMLCTPALLFSSMLTIPALLFPSPQQQAYFYFARVLDQDPTRWIILALTAICTVIALAVPAVAENPFKAARS